MDEYDFYLRHASVRDGAWVGFPLAWKGLAGVQGLPARPYLHWRPWVLDPDFPNDPASGLWGVWQWRMDVACIDFTATLTNMPPTDERTGEDIRADLHSFLSLPIIELKDADDATYTVKMTGFEESVIEPYDGNHPDGGWLVRVEFVEV
jgi:hypothetical protein